ncbi:MAG: hypothetical protein AAF657_24215 [Acidobacteriota bacterium]
MDDKATSKLIYLFIGAATLVTFLALGIVFATLHKINDPSLTITVSIDVGVIVGAFLGGLGTVLAGAGYAMRSSTGTT